MQESYLAVTSYHKATNITYHHHFKNSHILNENLCYVKVADLSTPDFYLDLIDYFCFFVIFVY